MTGITEAVCMCVCTHMLAGCSEQGSKRRMPSSGLAKQWRRHMVDTVLFKGEMLMPDTVTLLPSPTNL